MPYVEKWELIPVAARKWINGSKELIPGPERHQPLLLVEGLLSRMHLPATAWGVGWYIAGDCKRFGKHCCRVFISILVDINVKILLCYSITAYDGAHLSLSLSLSQ